METIIELQFTHPDFSSTLYYQFYIIIEAYVRLPYLNLLSSSNDQIYLLRIHSHLALYIY